MWNLEHAYCLEICPDKDKLYLNYSVAKQLTKGIAVVRNGANYNHNNYIC